MAHELFVLTGGPCTGKTTLGRELTKLGYDVLPEAARAVIQDEEGKERPILPWTDLSGFQKLVLERQLGFEARANGRPTFLDRSIIDNLAYCRVGSIAAPQEITNAVQEHVRSNAYKAIFLLDPVPYKQDCERREDPVFALRIHEAIGRVYSELGYDVTLVPVLETPAARARFVVSTLEAMAKARSSSASIEEVIAA